MKKIVLSLVCAMSLSFGSTLKYRNEAYENKDYAKALKIYEELASKGDAIAQDNLGNMYRNGQGVKYNDKKAFELYEKAAEKGYPNAQINLWYMYAIGQGVNQDYKKGLEWYEKAAVQMMNVNNLMEIGDIYYFGKENVDKDYKKALEWYKKASSKSVIPQFIIGNMYRNGQGVDKNDEKAFEWYKKAADEKTTTLDKELIVNKSYEEVIKWFNKKSEILNTDFNLGYVYYLGESTKPDYNKALELWKKAADKKDTYAQYYLGVMYKNGQGVDKNDNKAKEYFKKSCDNGLEKACNESILHLGY